MNLDEQSAEVAGFRRALSNWLDSMPANNGVMLLGMGSLCVDLIDKAPNPDKVMEWFLQSLKTYREDVKK